MPANIIHLRMTDEDASHLTALKERYNLDSDTDALRKALEIASCIQAELNSVYTASEAVIRVTSDTFVRSPVRIGEEYVDMLGHVWLKTDNGYGVPMWKRVALH